MATVLSKTHSLCSLLLCLLETHQVSSSVGDTSNTGVLKNMHTQVGTHTHTHTYRTLTHQLQSGRYPRQLGTAPQWWSLAPPQVALEGVKVERSSSCSIPPLQSAGRGFWPPGQSLDRGSRTLGGVGSPQRITRWRPDLCAQSVRTAPLFGTAIVQKLQALRLLQIPPLCLFQYASPPSPTPPWSQALERSRIKVSFNYRGWLVMSEDCPLWWAGTQGCIYKGIQTTYDPPWEAKLDWFKWLTAQKWSSFTLLHMSPFWYPIPCVRSTPISLSLSLNNSCAVASSMDLDLDDSWN